MKWQITSVTGSEALQMHKIEIGSIKNIRGNGYKLFLRFLFLDILHEKEYSIK